MQNTRTARPGLLGKARAYLRGDRYMVDSRPPTPVAAAPGAPPKPLTGAQAPTKET